jgi:hypothetical protein
MFTWVCQRCGKEVDVSETVCPYCSAEGAKTALGSAQGADRRPLEDDLRAERLPAPKRSALPPIPAPLPAPGHALAIRPLHLLMFVVVLALSLAGAIFLARPDLMTVEGVSLPKLPKLSGREEPPLQQGPVEVAGIRAWRDDQSKLRVRAVLVNHTPGPLRDLGYTITLFNPEAEDDAPAAATFTVAFDTPLQSRESREVEAELDAPDGLTALPEWNRMRVAIAESRPPE